MLVAGTTSGDGITETFGASSSDDDMEGGCEVRDDRVYRQSRHGADRGYRKGRIYFLDLKLCYS